MNIQEQKIKTCMIQYTLQITTPNVTGDFPFYSTSMEKQEYAQLKKVLGTLESYEDLEFYFGCPRWDGTPPPVFIRGITYIITLEETFTDSTENININRKPIATPVDRDTILIIEKAGKREKIYDIRILEKGHDDQMLVGGNLVGPTGTINRIVSITDSKQAKRCLDIYSLDSNKRSELNSYSQRYFGGNSIWEPEVHPAKTYVYNEEDEIEGLRWD